jgi:alkyldihydroxyacetonephosphate synthase
VTAAAGRSGVCGASVPAFGGVLLDLTAIAGIRGVDRDSMLVDVLPGTFGDVFEDELRAEHGVTCGHWPQSIGLSTVGGWLACRGAGQLSTRYGKIEDIVVGLDVVLADGTLVTTGGAPRAAVGPDLTQLFVGSEGTLGIIVGARLRAHPLPPAEARAAFAFTSFADGLTAMRTIVQRGATPAVLRLYDATEADRSYQTGDAHLLLVLDEGDAHLVDATMRIVHDACRRAGEADVALVGKWLDHRNDVSALEALISRGFVVDTMEVSAPWSALNEIYARATAAIQGVEHTLVASAHQSHSYTDGACLYFTFAGRPPEDERERYYRAAWDAGQRAVLEAGGALSHHHGVGLNRARFVAQALGPGLGVLQAVKDALDPNGILNPGKLGLSHPFGDLPWP